MGIEELRLDCAIKQKKGLHFIIPSILIWILISGIHMTSLPILTKNFYTFCATAPLMPLAFLISKLIKVDFKNEGNPLSNLGLLFSLNQILYILIAMWIYTALPENMVMVLAMIFGAHLLPFAWLYKSKSYMVMSVIISLSTLIIGLLFKPYIVAIVMILCEIIFSLLLVAEVKNLKKIIEL